MKLQNMKISEKAMVVDENLFFKEMTKRICGTLDVCQALESCVEYLQNMIPVSSVSVQIYSSNWIYKGNKNIFFTLESFSKTNRNLYIDSPHLSQTSINGLTLEWNKPGLVTIFKPPVEVPALAELLRHSDLPLSSSVMSLRLRVESKPFAVIVFYTEGINQYTIEHLHLIELLHDPFSIAITNALRHQEVLSLKNMADDDNRYLQNELREISGAKVIGAKSGLLNVMDMVQHVAEMESPVLLIGETGVGKDVIANAIHQQSARKTGSFIRVNCGAIPEGLIDSELFGHEKGAFTGAFAQRRGRFERANKGTIFLDEIGELPLQAQVRLLSVIQNRVIERVGGHGRAIPIDVRIISATHRHLPKMLEKGEFREDLWFRLNVFPITIPPLRHRKEDIPLLAKYFVDEKIKELKLGVKPVLAPEAMDRLTAYDWPGNVRELQNIIERELIQRKDGYLFFKDLPSSVHSQVIATPETANRKENILSMDDLNRQHIRHALSLSGGKIAGKGGAADLLKVNPNTLRKRMTRLGILSVRKKEVDTSNPSNEQLIHSDTHQSKTSIIMNQGRQQYNPDNADP